MMLDVFGGLTSVVSSEPVLTMPDAGPWKDWSFPFFMVTMALMVILCVAGLAKGKTKLYTAGAAIGIPSILILLAGAIYYPGVRADAMETFLAQEYGASVDERANVRLMLDGEPFRLLSDGGSVVAEFERLDGEVESYRLVEATSDTDLVDIK